MQSLALQLPDGLTLTRFLQRYWQKRPLLMRAAMPDFRDPYTPEELAGLACEETVETRLILEQARAQPWEVRHGPFNDADFLTLPATHWALLIQDAEKHIPELCALIEPFRFIPDWRIDDLMISYAPRHGSVGPHSDNYDVFLLQGMGRRRWHIDTRPERNDELVPDCELRVLRHFEAEQEWILEPGDMLYLPPGVAHYGIALEPCLTYSIGFRAPAYRELLEGFVDFLLDDVDPELRYGDADLTEQSNPGEISAPVLDKIKALLHQYLNSDGDMIESWFGRFITEPKPTFCAAPENSPYTDTDLIEYLRNAGVLERNPGSRFAYVDHGQGGETALFVDGQEFILGPDSAYLAPLLCRHRSLDHALLGNALRQGETLELVLDLVNEGYLVIYEDD